MKIINFLMSIINNTLSTYRQLEQSNGIKMSFPKAKKSFTNHCILNYLVIFYINVILFKYVNCQMNNKKM